MISRYQRALQVGALCIWAIALSISALPAAAETVRVAQVLDGDSLRLTDGREVRLIGINAPERGKTGTQDEPLAREASSALARLTAKRTLRLEYDAERFDRYGRTLAHAFLPDNRSVEESLLRDGFAFQIAQAPNLARITEYSAAEAEARRAKRGVWNHSYYNPREVARMGTSEGGFRFVEGRVQRVGRGGNAVYLDLNEHFTLVIEQEDWHFFGGDPQRYLHRRVIARGWVTARENRSRMKLSHPTMVEVLD